MSNSTLIEQPFPIFFDGYGNPLSAGYIYVGEYGLNPQANPIQTFWDEALTQVAVQPIRTINGYYSNNGTPAKLYISGSDCSIMVLDKNKLLVFSDLKSSGSDSIDANKVNVNGGGTQQQINDRGGATWYAKAGGYNLNDRVILDNGDIVRSTVASNTIDPNVDMAGWINTADKGYVGLSNVDNTSDIDKPVSTSTALAIIAATQDKVSDQELTEAVAPKADLTYVDTAIGAISTDASKQYATLALANADIASISLNQNVFISEAVNGGYWYKATAGATSLTKSPYDPLTQAENYTDAYASVKNKDISNISIDALQTRGQYRVTGSNLPTVTGLPFNSACDIQVYGETVTLWQMVKQYNSNNIAVRSSNGGSTVSWNPWVYSAFKSDIPAINIFPNPELTAKNSAQYSGTTTKKDGITTLVMTGGAVSVSQTMYDVAAVGLFAVGNTIAFSADVYADATGNTTSADIALIFYDSVGTALSTVSQGKTGAVNAYEKITVSRAVPANCVRVRMRFVRRTNATIGKFKNVVLQSSAQAMINLYASAGSNSIKTVYVSPTGLDSNAGTIDAPFLTMQKAASEVYPNGRVIMRGGDYIGTSTGFNIAGFDYFEADAYKDEKVRVIQGTLLIGVSKTDGYTKVYQAALTSSPYRYIFVHDVPDVNTLIPASERHPLQRGETYRLSSTKIVKVTSIADIEAATKPSWYYDSVSKIVYFSVPSGVDALTAQIRLPLVGNGLIYGGTGIECVRISNMTIMYGGLRSVDARNLAGFEYSNIFAFGGRGAGIVKNDTLVSIGEFNRAAANNDDGFNGHRYELGGTQNVHKESSMWTHDNGDDGESLHEYCIGEYNNIISEYNGDRGAAPAYGAHCTYNGFVFRKNGQEADRDDGAGIGVVGASSEGVGTQAILFNGISDGNVTNYRTGAADAQITAVNCHSFNAIEAGYAGDSGTVTITNCGDIGSAVVKRGNVIVKNTTQVT